MHPKKEEKPPPMELPLVHPKKELLPPQLKVLLLRKVLRKVPKKVLKKEVKRNDDTYCQLFDMIILFYSIFIIVSHI